ncbi:LysR family transcriptional regulator [Puteibacter caeruleilacunae]|nr:LysR family transcriptional regulator [Puteibacter caeruleilacunae]
MDYRDKVFLTVAENLSFSKAATELFISQPAVTKHIKELENKLNTSLFERKGNKIYLTRSGKLAYDHLRKIRQQYEELDFELARINNAYKGTLKIGASSTIFQYLIPQAIAAFHKRYPQIELFLFNGNSFEMEQKLLDNQLDIAMVENYASQSNIKYSNFLDDEIVAVTGTDSIYAKQKEISTSELLETPIVLREIGSGTLQVIQQAFTQHQIPFDKLNILIHLGSTEAIKHFLTNFDGIGLISKRAIEKELRLKELKTIPLNDFCIKRQFRIASRQGHENPSAQLFREFLNHYNF